jgi:hypothetical protein
MRIDAGNHDRPVYILGPVSNTFEIAKVAAREGAGEQGTWKLSFLVDDERVHTADIHLLPGPGDIQDPVDSGTDYPDLDTGGGFATVVRLHNPFNSAGNTGIPDDTYRGGKARITLQNDGVIAQYGENNALGGAILTSTTPGEWLNTSPVDTAVAAQYDVIVEDVYGDVARMASVGAVLTGTFDTWQNLGTSRAWSLYANNAVSIAMLGPESVTAAFRIRIRRASTGLVLATSKLVLSVTLGVSPP